VLLKRGENQKRSGRKQEARLIKKKRQQTIEKEGGVTACIIQIYFRVASAWR